jgi:Fic/DOC family
MPSLDELCQSWDDSCSQALLTWISRNESQIRRLKSGSLGHSPVTKGYVPRYDISDHTPRSLEELNALQFLHPEDCWKSVNSNSLDEYLISLANLLDPGASFRTRHSATLPDRLGQAVRYPSHHLIKSQIIQLTEWLKRNQSHPIGCAPIAMNAVFNIHPFADRNGRSGRVLFNLLCRTVKPSLFIPLFELSVMSQGEFTLRLRLAQYRSQWQPLIKYIDSCAAYVKSYLITF